MSRLVSEDTLLTNLVASLSLKDETLVFNKSLGIMCWVDQPQQRHMSNAISVDELLILLRDHLHILQDSKDVDLPRLKLDLLEKPLHLTPYSNVRPPALKPNLLMISLKLLDVKRTERDAATSAKDLVDSTFSGIDFIAPRKVIKSIITKKVSNEPWEALVSRPISGNGTLFIDRVDLYETNDGSIGNLFEAAMTVPSKYQRLYAVSRVTLGGSSIVLSGEIDAFDGENSPIEIKSRPAWAKFDANRQFQNHTQCVLAGVKKVITGGFRAERGVRNGPVSFHKNDLQQESLKVYGSMIPSHIMTDAYHHASDVLKEMQTLCSDVGKVYKVRSVFPNGRRGKLIEVEELTGDAADGYPITADVLERCAEAVLTIAANSSK